MSLSRLTQRGKSQYETQLKAVVVASALDDM